MKYTMTEVSNPVAAIERWQDCPTSGIDFDLADDQMVFDGETFYCAGCGEHHVATAGLIQQYERTGDERPRVVPLQRRTPGGEG